MAKPKKIDPLDKLADGDPLDVIALMLWKDRHKEPDMYVQIDRDDLEKYNACMAYQKFTPQVIVSRPQGIPAQAYIPAAPGHRAVPTRAAIPAKPYVLVTLVNKGTNNAIRPVENNEEDYDIAQNAALVRKSRDQAPAIAQRLLNEARSGEYSTSTMQDAHDALLALSQAV